MKKNVMVGYALGTVGLLASGCQTQALMRTSARSAADQLLAVKLEVQEKAGAESAYYRKQQELLADVLFQARRDDFQLLLEKEARAFAAANKTGQADIETFLTAFLEDWLAKESSRQTRIDEVADQLAQVETTLDASSGQIDALLKKLRVLSEAQSKAALAKFAAGFVDSTYKDFEAAQATPGQ